RQAGAVAGSGGGGRSLGRTNRVGIRFVFVGEQQGSGAGFASGANFIHRIYIMLVFSAWKQKRRGVSNYKLNRVERLEGRLLLSGGLTGVYFDNQDFTGTKFNRIDPT